MEILNKYREFKNGKFVHNFAINTYPNLCIKAQSTPLVPLHLEIGLLFITFAYSVIRVS